jgi:hypothetical protein
LLLIRTSGDNDRGFRGEEGYPLGVMNADGLRGEFRDRVTDRRSHPIGRSRVPLNGPIGRIVCFGAWAE